MKGPEVRDDTEADLVTSDGPLGRRGALLERDHSLAALAELMAGVRATGTGRLVLVGGEAGVGKTSLLRWFCDSEDARVLWGGCEPLRTPRPLGPLWDIAEAGAEELHDLLAGAPRPGEIAMALLRDLRARSPTILVLEDLQWADEATLDVASLLTTRIGSAPALVLGSFRDDELDRSEQLRVLLGELVRGPGRLSLAPLSPAAVAGVAASEGLDPAELYGKTGGNPLFLTEVLAARGTEIPDTVRDAVLARAARLPEPARELLEVVAVIPGAVELWLLEALAGDLLAHLQDCLAAGMLTATGAHVSFRHELARLAIDEAIVPHRRVALNRAALTALASRLPGTDLARLAHHAEAAGDGDGVLRWAPAAGARAAGSGAHRQAAAQYARALRFGDALGAADRADLLRARADECFATDQFLDALAAQEQALACYRQVGDQRGEGDSLRSLSRLMFFLLRSDEGEQLAAEAVALLEPLGPSHELAMAYANVSQRRTALEEAQAAEVWGARALDLAESLDDTEALVYALTNIGAAQLQGGHEPGRDKLERALALALRHGLDQYAGRAYAQLSHCSLRWWQFELAQRYLDDGLKFCADQGLDTWRLYLLARRARLELGRGCWEQAADSAATVLRDPRSAPVPRGWALVVRGLVRARRGDPDAEAPLREAHQLVRHTGEIDRIGEVASARAEQAWLGGDPGKIEPATEAALALAQGQHADWLIAELTYWRRQAAPGTHRVTSRRPGTAAPTPYGLANAGWWIRAAGRWEEIGCPYEAALAMAGGDDPEAMLEAIDRLQGMGARPAAAIVARRLRERGVRGIPRGPRRRTRDNPAGLTPRELEVLTHLVQGLRNAQIAQRLVVSEKTVDHHVSAVLRKLGVSSRGEASAEATRLGLTGRP